MSYSSLKKLRSTVSVLSAVMVALMLLFSFGLVAASNASAPSLEAGQRAPEFKLADLSGKSHSISDFKGKVVVLEWTNPGCPFVAGHYKTGNMQALQKKYGEAGVIWLAINSTSPSHSDSKSAKELNDLYAGWKAGYTAQLIDSEGHAGKLYNAKTTPHMFVIDKEGMLAYQGAIDDDRSTNGGKDATVNYVSQAVDELLAGKPVSVKMTKQYGCGIKY
ncbi:MAG: thioredoxin family protein [Chlorobiales bacterium]|nr:thioredoxin family protein [Chlorobiales bacterium]